MHKMIHLAEISRKLLLMILVCTSYLGGSVFAQETQQQDVDVLQIKKHAEYSEKGADTCLKCHDEDSDYPVMDIFRTPHGSTADKHSPFAQQQCESCHGPVGKHDKNRIRKGESREPMIAFDKHSQVPVAERNAICASCHEKVDQSHWQGSIHQVSDVACSDCHTVHADRSCRLAPHPGPHLAPRPLLHLASHPEPHLARCAWPYLAPHLSSQPPRLLGCASREPERPEYSISP